MLDIKITLTNTPKAKPADETKLGFGKIFSDHMFVMDYTAGQGWHDARIVPYAPFHLDPACVIFHYAQEIFEGMKAYRAVDGKIQLFRPDCNAKRMQDSSDPLYIRPFVFATDVSLGVHASPTYTFCVIVSPSGAYYAEGINPVRIYVEDMWKKSAA